MLIRPERPEDIPTIRDVHERAFPSPTEARLVDLLRERGKTVISLVAELDGVVVGHILFSPVTIDAAPKAHGLGLAPVAVLPNHQRRGIGSRLIEEGLRECRRFGCRFLVVLGEPDYYQRFGFQRASADALTNEYGADDPFMVFLLQPDALPASGGLVRYAPEFAEAVGGQTP